MKKVAEFVEMYRKASDKAETLKNVCLEILGDVLELARLRRAESNGAMIAILEEANNRWERFAANFPELRKDGFIELQRKRFPEVHSIWMRAREERRSRQSSVRLRGHEF